MPPGAALTQHSMTSILLLHAALAAELTVQPYLQSATPTDIWVFWETNTGEQSLVEWGPTPALGESTEGAAVEGYGMSRLHGVNLTGLSPATRYHYQVTTADVTSETFDFVTPPAPKSEATFRMIALSDIQRDAANPDKWSEIINDGVIPFLSAETGDALSASASMLLIAGDLVDNGVIYPQWADEFFAPAADLLPYMPLYPVPGNHEQDSEYYFQYFHLPEDGTPGYEEHWYTTDYANVRVIGLDSNIAYRLPIQITWLEAALADSCVDPTIDFVFAQLHHPHRSELWVDGETDFTSEVVGLLEAFSDDCDKPSAHFFGHTHGYSRGQSRDHRHLWVNVATAGGNIDYFGEYGGTDYTEFSVTLDEWGFVVLDVEAGDNPNFRLRRVSRGDETLTLDNEVKDELVVYRDNSGPADPEGIYPAEIEVSPDCVELKAGDYSDPEGDLQGAVHWQVSDDCDDWEEPAVDVWHNHENWYFDEDTRAGEDLSDEQVQGLQENTDYCWRVRYRDRGLSWSAWSDSLPFSTGTSVLGDSLLVNGDAEDGTSGWETIEGVFESLSAGECGGIEPYEGERYFVVGGLCKDEAEFGQAEQSVDVSTRSAEIDGSGLSAVLTAQLRNWDGSDQPAVVLRFEDESGAQLGTSELLSTTSSAWTSLSTTASIPAGTRSVVVVLTGTRTTGSDNDSYADALSLRLGAGFEDDCDAWVEPDTGTADTGGQTEPGDTSSTEQPTEDGDTASSGDTASAQPGTDEVKVGTGCGCQTPLAPTGWVWVLTLLAAARRR